ncbi:hypothetical protein GCM10010840_32000 [Deinococcus aerolatus]|uniref:Lipoprotein n=2 Tax=Deinococcus aerolatus TaxID=522487 RepID=A0ABQ2GEB6_9DEIO|nr:hypothetical protein GCM10010840_32000 [Deinococcus aerolatus]
MLWTGVVLGSLGLSGCSSLPPAPLAGDLLGAPTTLNLDGQVMRLTATPQLRQDTQRFIVRVRVRANPSAARPVGRPLATPRPLKVTGLYVVTGSGLWQSPRLNDVTQASTCRERVCAWGSGEADGFTAGEDVRVIAQLRDASGQIFWLRDVRDQRIAVGALIR